MISLLATLVRVNNTMPVVINHQKLHMACTYLGTPPLGGGVNSAWLGVSRIFQGGDYSPLWGG